MPETTSSSESSLFNMTSPMTRSQMHSSNGSHLNHHNQPHPDTSCHYMGRKKRRGMIEKRRRDRINNSLNELRRLVPAAFEKQGSAKLEKAEILQMTVDHLTMLHAKGFDAFSFDPHKFAMDYHSIGFRECTTEAGRYLIEREGMDLQDPLRLRLLSHLQCYAAQRELSLKASAHPTAWNPSAFTTPHQFATPSIPAPSQSALNSSHSSTDSYWNPPSMSSSATSSSMDHHHHPHHQMSMSHGHMMPPPSSLIKSSPCSSPASSSACPSSSSMSNHLYSSASLSTASGHQYFPPGYGHVVPASSGQINGSSASVKQFRPWGGELVY